MLYGFSWITGGSYALALLLYALVFKLVFLPFTIKQQKNQIASAKLAPKIAIIRAKYKGRNDRATMLKMQEEITELQKQEGQSPLSGCLPLLIQMPIIIFLYNVIRNPLSYICQMSTENINAVAEVVGYTAPKSGIDQISLISKINEAMSSGILSNLEGYGATRPLPDFTIFGSINLADTPSITNITWLVLIPVLAAVSQWFTMWISRKLNGNSGMQQADAQTQKSMMIMDIIFPAMTLFMAFGFSGMLGLYWVYQSIFSILQTLILSKLMPIPKYTEEELKEMRKAEKAAEKAQKEALKNQPKYRSLHYIDEEDEDIPDLTVKQKKNDKMGEL